MYHLKFSSFYQLSASGDAVWRQNKFSQYVYPELQLSWDMLRLGESSHRIPFRSSQFTGGEFPQRLYIGFTPTDTWVGTYGKHSGWLVPPPGLRSISIDYGDGQAQTVVKCTPESPGELWHWNQDQLHLVSPNRPRPLMNRKMFGQCERRNSFSSFVI